MNVVYTTFTDDKEWLELAKIMITSLLENTSVDSVCAGMVVDNTDSIREICDLGVKVIPFIINKRKWEKNRMAYKIEMLAEVPFVDNARVFVLDADIFVKQDIFKWFHNSPDVILTVRPEFFLSVNGGVWGFKNGGQGRKFVDFFIQQMKSPTWDKFKQYRVKQAHDVDGRDWWMDQDFLCAVNDHGLPFECNVKKMHCRTHNCSPSKRGLVECVNNPDKHIVHFKGGLKSYWLAYYPKYRRRNDGKQKSR